MGPDGRGIPLPASDGGMVPCPWATPNLGQRSRGGESGLRHPGRRYDRMVPRAAAPIRTAAPLQGEVPPARIVTRESITRRLSRKAGHCGIFLAAKQIKYRPPIRVGYPGMFLAGEQIKYRLPRKASPPERFLPENRSNTACREGRATPVYSLPESRSNTTCR